MIGNSKFFGHPLPSDEILAAILTHFGFHLETIERMRRRLSKTGLTSRDRAWRLTVA